MDNIETFWFLLMAMLAFTAGISFIAHLIDRS